MAKKLFDYFERKFDENFKGITPQEAFQKTTEQIGFEAYSSYDSFARVRRKKKSNSRTQ